MVRCLVFYHGHRALLENCHFGSHPLPPYGQAGIDLQRPMRRLCLKDPKMRHSSVLWDRLCQDVALQEPVLDYPLPGEDGTMDPYSDFLPHPDQIKSVQLWLAALHSTNAGCYPIFGGSDFRGVVIFVCRHLSFSDHVPPGFASLGSPAALSLA